MAGGSGTRFWPASRSRRPKQLLKLVGERSMLQMAVDRLAGFVADENILVVTNRDQAAAVAEQLPRLSAEQIVGEPCGRDTAACIGLAAEMLLARDPEAVMLVCPSDGLIDPPERFRTAVEAGAGVVADMPGSFVTFGIKPTFPATGYGYIHRSDLLREHEGVPVYRVEAFREKPDRERAEGFLDTGEYYWNSGLFVWRAAAIREALAAHTPELAAALERIAAALDRPDRDEVIAREYEPLERISIDYAVMEHATDVYTVEAPFTWDDVGSWSALTRLLGTDEDGNTVAAKHGGMATQGCIVFGDRDHLVATLGVSDLIIVHTPDTTLVANRRDDEAIKQLVEALRKMGFDEHL